MVTDVGKLKGKMAEQGITQGRFCDLLRMNVSTFIRKMQNHGLSFSVQEIHEMADILHLTAEDVAHIFFIS